MLAEQLAQRAQTLELGGPVEPVPGRRALRLDRPARSMYRSMRADQPVVSAASWMVRASRIGPTLPRLCQGLPGAPTRPGALSVASRMDLRFLCVCSYRRTTAFAAGSSALTRATISPAFISS